MQQPGKKKTSLLAKAVVLSWIDLHLLLVSTSAGAMKDLIAKMRLKD